MAEILQESSDPISLSIKINGKVTSDSIEVIAVFVSKEVNRIPFAMFKILDGGVFGLENEKFTNSEGDDFIPGNDVKIDMGYGDKRETVFTGIILSQRLVVKKNTSYLEITCKDKAVKLTKGRFTNIFNQVSDSDAFAKILGKFDLKVEIDKTDINYGQLVQHNSSYWDFILMRAELNNLLVISSDNTLQIKKLDFGSSAVLKILADQSVISADLDLDSEEVVKEFNLTSWDDATQEINSVSTNVSDGNEFGNINTNKLASVLSGITSNRSTSASLTKEELNTIGKSVANRIVLNKITGKIQVPGTSKVNPGDFVQLKGFNSRYDGKAFVSQISHEMEAGNWITTLFIGMSSKYHSSMPQLEDHDAGGNLPAAKSLLIGKVLAIDDDQDENLRVKVSLPAFKNEGEGFIWARMTFDYASNNCGLFFFPEVGDEVLVGFVNSDPRFPVIVGSMYNKKNISKETPDEKNQFKSIVTKSGISIKFDDEDKILTIETPEGNKVTLNDKEKMLELKDMNGNKLTMNDSGISLESPKDIKISAKGKITLDAIGELGISSKADIMSKGLNINLEAQVGLKAAGNASAELSASGQTTVKGAMVMIN